MQIVEILYKAKKNAVKFYKDYFTEEGAYTSLLSDKAYLKRLYKKRMGKELNLKNPQTFTEKLNWLKLYDRNPEYTMMADKYAVRKYIAEKIGEEYLVPLVGVWDNVEEIDFDALPDKFVLKCNHDNGVIICTDKSKLDIEKTKKELQYHLSRDYYKKCREWPYKDIKRKIICEKFMENNDGSTNIEYKVFCFSGKPKFICVISDRFSDKGICVDFYTMDWSYLDIKQGEYRRAGNLFKEPKNIKELILLSEILCGNIPFVRIDFNFWNNNLYFGEITFFDSAGFEEFKPPEWSITIGEWIKLPKKRRG